MSGAWFHLMGRLNKGRSSSWGGAKQRMIKDDPVHGGLNHGRRHIFWSHKEGFGGTATIFFTLTPLLLNFPTLDIVFWVGKSESLPTQSLNVKREFFIYHNTVLFLHKSRVGNRHPNSLKKGKFRVGNAYPNYFQGVHMPTLPTQCRRPWAKQRMIKYRLCRRYDWMQKLGYWNIETFPCMGGLSPPSP